MGMGSPDMPKPARKPAPVTPEDSEVKAAGQRELDTIRKKRGRESTNITGQRGLFGQKTGQV